MVKHKCPVCGEEMIIDECNVCENCGWEDDVLQENEPDYRGGSNWVSLNEAKSNYEQYGVAMSDNDKAEYRVYCEEKYGIRKDETENNAEWEKKQKGVA